MKRIVNGHYTDPASSRTISEISPPEFEGIKEAILHLKTKHNFLLQMSDDGFRKVIQISQAQSSSPLSSMPLDEFAMSDEVISDARKALQRDFDIAVVLESRIILLALSNTMDEIKDLLNDEFRVLIDAIRHTCVDFTNVINSSKEEMLQEVSQINVDGIIPEDKIKDGLDKFTSEEYKEKIYQKAQILYSILESINQPYEEAEYFDSEGNKFETKKTESNPPNIN